MGTVGERIKELRTMRGGTVEYLAEVTGVSHLTIDAIEKENHLPPLNELFAIIDALGSTPAYIIFDIKYPQNVYFYENIAKKLEGLTPAQLQTVENIVDAYIKSL